MNDENWRENIVTLKPILIIALLVGGIFVAVMLYRYFMEESEFESYNLVSKDDEFSSGFQIVRIYKGYSYIILTGNKKLIIAEAHNKMYQPFRFSEFVFSCDSISKSPKSDTIFLYRRLLSKTEKYFFIID